MKRLGIIILTLIMSVNLAACSIKDVIGNSDDPKVGVWNAVTASMMGIDSDVAEMFEKGVTLELKAQGKYDMMMDGKKTNGKWSYKDGDLKLSQKGVDFSGHIENSLLILTDMLDIGLDLTFQREGGYAGVAYP